MAAAGQCPPRCLQAPDRSPLPAPDPAALSGFLLPGGRPETVPGPGESWRALPPVPRGTAALAAGPGSGAFDALAVSGGTLTVYRLTPAGTWTRTQAIKVPIQYGSSG
jgi:hypothetical protein